MFDLSSSLNRCWLAAWIERKNGNNNTNNNNKDGFQIEMCVKLCDRMTESNEIEATTFTITSIYLIHKTLYTIRHTGNG